jgi:hypothetical protein
MLLAIAVVWEEKGEWGFAVETYRRFLDRTERYSSALDEKWHGRRKLAEGSVAELAEKLRGTHGFVSVVTEPPGAAVLMNGRRAGADEDASSPFGAYVPAGPAVVRAELEGRLPAEATVEVLAGKLHPVSLTLPPSVGVSGQPAAEGLEPARAPVTAGAGTPGSGSAQVAGESTPFDGDTVVHEGSEQPPGRASRLVPWVVLGAAAAAAGTGAVFTFRAVEARDDQERLARRPDPPTKSEWDDAQSRKDDAERLSWIFYGGSAALAVGGVSWLVLAPAPGGARVAVGLRF